MSSGLFFNLQFGRNKTAAPRDSASPLHVLVMGDFSVHDASQPPVAARLKSVDIDNFDTVFRAIRPQIELPAAGGDGPGATIAFESLEDFHPDHLYDTLDVVGELRASRERLCNPATYDAEAATLLADSQALLGDASPAEADDAAGEAENDDATLGRLLGREASTGSAPPPRTGLKKDLDQLIHDLVAPHISKGAGPQQEQLLASVDAAISEQIRAVLHAPAFQALESSWRGLHELVFSNEAGEDFRISILNIGKAALYDDLAACEGDLRQSRLAAVLNETSAGGPGGEPWSLVIGDFTFGPGADDLFLLAALGAASAQAGGPFIAAAHPALAGCDDLVQHPDSTEWPALDAESQAQWSALRESEVASWIGLAMPRVLGRLPYGKGSDPADRFDFRELPPQPDHGAFLWINPAYACARLIAASFAASGWEMKINAALDLTDLPLALFEQAGGAAIKPCAEVHLSHASADALAAQGLMAFMSHRDRNAARLGGFHAIASPARPLAGAWSD